ncbi:MAG: carboxymuconolactone decarboxylase family protein [Nitrospinota bacterium]
MEAIKADYKKSSVDEKTRAMLEFSGKMTREAARMTEQDVSRLRSAGLTDVEILEVVAIAGYFNFCNRFGDALGVALDPEYEEMVRWAKQNTQAKA